MSRKNRWLREKRDDFGPRTLTEAHLDFAFAQLMMQSCCSHTEYEELRKIGDVAGQVLYRAGVPLSHWGQPSFIP